MDGEGTVRLKLLVDSYEKLKELKEQAMRVASRAFTAELVHAHVFGQDQEEELYNRRKEADNLFHFIVTILASRVKSSDGIILPNEEPLTPQNANDIGIKELCEKIVNKTVLKGDRARMFEKVSEALDFEVSAEKEMLNDFEFLLKCHEYWESLYEDGAKASKNTYKAEKKENISDIYNKLMNGPFYDSQTMIKLDRLGKLGNFRNRNS